MIKKSYILTLLLTFGFSSIGTFLNSIEEQVRRWGNLSPKQKLALNKMYKRFLKKSEKKT